MSFAPKHSSGVDLIDDAWGGLYRGGSYLVYGRSAGGCGLLTLAFTRCGARLGESTLFISADRQKNLIIQAASIGFDLRRACNSGIVRLMHVPPVVDLRDMEDDRVARALDDLVTLVRKNRPTRLVMNDFMPFVSFQSFSRLRHEFVDFLQKIDPVDTTMMLLMPEPANEQSRRVIEFMADEMTGSIHVELPEGVPDTTRRKITLTPQVGHLRRQIVKTWDLEALVLARQDAAVQDQESEPDENDLRSDPRSSDPGGSTASTASVTPKETAAPKAPSAQLEPAAEPRSQTPEFQSEDTDEFSDGPRLLTPPIGTVFREIPIECGPYDVLASKEIPEIAPPSPVRPARDIRRPGEASRSGRTEPEVSPESRPRPESRPSPEPRPRPDPDSSTPQDESMNHAPSTAEPDTRSPGSRSFQAPDLLETTPTSPVAPGAPDTTDREAFRIRLQQRFNTREAVGEPFLLVALRMDRSRGREIGPFDFEFLMDLVHDSIGTNDDMLVDPNTERLVVLLSSARSDDAQPFFSDLKERLREHSPARSDDLLHSVSAIVVPDGQPFRSAEEFLGYALDED